MHFKPAGVRKTIDDLMAVAAVVHPMMGVPQVLQIFQAHDAGGVSLATWLGFMIIGLVFLAYGVIHRIWPLIVTQVLWFIVDFAVVTGVLLYG